MFHPPTVNTNWDIAWTKLSRKRTKSETSKIAKITFFRKFQKNNLARHSFGMYSIQLWCFIHLQWTVTEKSPGQNYHGKRLSPKLQKIAKITFFFENFKNNLAKHSFGIYSIQLWCFFHLHWPLIEKSPGQNYHGKGLSPKLQQGSICETRKGPNRPQTRRGMCFCKF